MSLKQTQGFPTVVLIGGGAAGLWTAMALVEEGWNGDSISIIEPSGKTGNDRTWSYWAKDSLLPEQVRQLCFSQLSLASDGKRKTYTLEQYRYFSVRSSEFYRYAKTVLAKAGVTWISEKVISVKEKTDCVELSISNGSKLMSEFVLDSRPPDIELPSSRYNVTSQHFGGWFLQMPKAVFNPEEVVFMDFVTTDDEVAFFYVIPSSETEALVEIAVFSDRKWERTDYDRKIEGYLTDMYSCLPNSIYEKEYGTIPMTDQPFWRENTDRIWNIGTRGGWVQPSSGYAFTRTARFAKQVAKRLKQPEPKPWSASTIHQVFNSVMLGYILDNPKLAGSTFYNLFASNGPDRTFDFLDEIARFGQTVQLMWSCPQLPFATRAIKEVLARITKSK